MNRTSAEEIIQAYPQSAHVAKYIVDVAENLGIDARWLANVIRSESNFSTTITNSIGATGLIQFIPSTARSLGTTTDELRVMSPKDQMQYVQKYFQPYKSKLKDQNTVVLAVFYPKALGKPDDWDMAGDYASGKAQYGTEDWNYYLNRFMSQNGGIRYAKDYYKKFLSHWKLDPLVDTKLTIPTQRLPLVVLSISTSLLLFGVYIKYAKPRWADRLLKKI